MTTSFENLTTQKLTLISKNINLEIDPKEILDIDTSTFIEGTLLFTIKNQNQNQSLRSIWKGYVPIKNSETIKIFNNIHLKINDTIIPNILEPRFLENFENEKIKETFFYKNKFKIILFILILFILFFGKKYLKQK